MKVLCCDIGSGSVRVAIFEYLPENVLQTKPLAVSTAQLTIYNKQVDLYEQKTEEIWEAFCKCTSQCLQKSGLHLVANDSFPIDAVAFSATCSLVIVEEARRESDIIMWMDHRAIFEAEIINKTGHEVLSQFGGICSPEFSLSKLFWLYRNDRLRFDNAKAFMELSDWMTYRCSQYFGTPSKFPRSLCCVTCKWGYDAKNNCWRGDLFNLLGMTWSEQLHERIGNLVINPGVRAASLSVTAAKEIGFIFQNVPSSSSIKSVALASSLIDAHAGVISMLVFAGNGIAQSVGDGRSGNSLANDPYENVFCMISGTSTCHMVLNRSHCATPGVWGPYKNAIIPGYHLREAGQSCTGKLIERIIASHYGDKLPSPMSQIIASLNEQLQGENFNHQTSLIVNPSFHGTRSLTVNPNLKGAIYGFTLEKPTLLPLYVATVEAIAYETRFIIEELEKNSQPIKRILVTGGLTKNEFYLQIHADVLGLELSTFSAGDADLMLVGASVIALTATQVQQSHDSMKLTELLENLKAGSNGFQEHFRVFKPRAENEEYHQRKYKCYRHLLACCQEMEAILK